MRKTTSRLQFFILNISFFCLLLSRLAAGSDLPQGWSLQAAPAGAVVDLCEAWAAQGVQVQGFRDGAYISCDSGPMNSRAGQAYWVYAPKAASLDRAAAPGAPVSVALQRGWNLVGNPFDKPLAWDGSILADGLDVRSSAKVFPLLICFNPETGGYETATAMAPGAGCVVLAREAVTLTLPVPGSEPVVIVYEPIDPELLVTDPETGLPYIAGQIIVQKADGVSGADFEAAMAAGGFRVIGRNGYLGLYQIAVPQGMSEGDALALLAAAPEAGPAVRHRVLSPGAYAPNDPPWQGGPVLQRWAFERVNAPDGWELAAATGPAIAVVDTGVDALHPDLAGRVSGGADFIASGGDGGTDAHGHGTHVAGIIAAAMDNGAGMAGVCPQCRIVPVRVCHAGACPFFAVMNGVVYAANSGARVINLSIEGQAAPGSPEWQIFQNVVDYAAARGAFVVAAAGNGGAGADTVIPAALNHVYSVGAMDANERPASFSNTGPAVDLFAPGVNVYSLEPGGAAGMRDGTSMAAAFTSGAVGLITGIAPTVTNNEIEDVLKEFSDSLGTVPVHNGGVLDIEAVLRQFNSGNRAPVIDTLALSELAVAPGGSVTATVVARDPDGDLLEYRWETSGGVLQGAARDVKTWAAFPERGRYAVRVTVTDSKGGSDTAEAVLDVGLDGLTNIVIFPRTAQLAAGDIVAYRSRGHFTDGSVWPVRPLWSVDNGRGVMSPDGIFTALDAGMETVHAHLGGFSDTLAVAVDSALPGPAFSPAAMTNRNPAPAMDTANAAFIVIGDLDDDGDNDFISVSGNGTPNVVHINNGGYAFSQSSFIPNSEANMAVLADVDHDGYLDLIEAGIGTTPGVRFFSNNGSGGFPLLSMTLGAADVRSVYVRDMDHDTMPDIVAGIAGAGNSPTIYWNSMASFNVGNSTTIAAAACGQKHTLVADVNKDGWADIVTACSTGSTEVFINNKNRTFTSIGTIAGSSLATQFAYMADVNGDDDEDYVALRAYNDAGTDYEEYNIFSNNGSGVFALAGATARWERGSGSRQFDMADHDNDGDIDIYAAPKSATEVGKVFVNSGAGVFGATSDTFPAPVDTLSVGDLSGDHAPDVINNRQTTTIWENNNSTPNNVAGAPTNLTQEIALSDFHMEWDWAQAGESTTQSLATFDLRMEYNDFTASYPIYYGVAPERPGNIGHATRTAGTYGYHLPDTAVTTGIIEWSVRAVDTQFGRGPWSATQTIGCPVVSNLADQGIATLRDCIEYANNNASTTITFDPSIYGGTIYATSSLPPITGTKTEISGQFADITIEGSACAGCDGLTVSGASTVYIKGLTITNFPGDGIEIADSSGDVHIGGYMSLGQGNTIINNGQAGVQVTNSSSANYIQGNAIGTNFGAATGTQSLGNTYGIRLSRGAAFIQFVVIGDSAAGAPNSNLGNIIAYNTTNGVLVDGGTFFGQSGANRNKFTSNSIYANGGAGDKAIRLNGAGAHGSPAPIAPPTITNMVCSATPGAFDVTFQVSNLTAANSDVYFYRVDNDVTAPLTAPDTTAGEGFAYLGYATAGGVIGVNTKTATIAVSDADGDYISAVRYHPGAGPANYQGFSEFANNYAIPSCGPCPGWKVTNNNATGDGSLYACIEEANSTAGAQTITFAAAYTIQPVTATPYVISDATGGTTIDGDFNGDGVPDVIVDGTACVNCHGFILRSGSNTLKNLTIVNFNDSGACPTDNFWSPNCAGVYIKDAAASNKIQGSRIGTSDGATAAGNYYGIYIDDGASSSIVGTDNDSVNDANEGNLISGNLSFGVFITSLGAYSQNNVVAGNIIGADIAGAAALKNNANGIYIYQRARNNQIGGPDPDQRNIISGNNGSGIAIDNGDCSGNKIQGNYIGTDITGALPLGNARGIHIKTDTQNNVIGTDGDGLNDAAERNIISGNNSFGVIIDGNNTAGNRVAGNYIGVQQDGINVLDNDIGIFINGGNNNFIGTNNDLVNDNVEGNIISGNSRYGIELDGNLVNKYVIMKNVIGLAADGSTQPNGWNGIKISGGAKNNLIGSATDTAYANVIAENGLDGIYVKDANSDNNAFLRNSIYNNAGLGIILNNDGANQNMAAPVISTVVNTGGSDYDITGTSACGAGCTVEVFVVDNPAAPVVAADPSGAGEGFRYATRTITTAGGAWSVTGLTEGTGARITATITDTDTAVNPFGNTSPFALNMNLPISKCPGWEVTTLSDVSGTTGSLRECIKEANTAGGGKTITFNAAVFNSTINLTGTLPTLTTDNVVIRGAGAFMTLDGGGTVTNVLLIEGDDNTVTGLKFQNFTGRAIKVQNGGSGNTIGGAGLNEGNTAIGAGNHGLEVDGAASINNTFSRNIVYDSALAAINLGAGANSGVLPPAIACSDDLGGGSYNVEGTTTPVCNGCTIELFQANDGAAVLPDAVFNGEAFAYVGTATTNAAGEFSATITFPAAAAGTHLTATRTDTNGNTSKFAVNYDIINNPTPCSFCPGWQVKNNADSGVNSLRGCIEEANASGSGQTITFTISNQTIAPITVLPDIMQDSVIIDGTGQNITLSGASCAGCDGLTFASDTGAVKALTIGGFTSGGTNAGIVIDGASGTVISGCRIGNNGSATIANDYGIYILNGGKNSTIGGTTAAARNIISGNTYGIYISGATSSGNSIAGNYIGTDSIGNAALANTQSGIRVFGNNNSIGGAAAAQRNVISGNGLYGVHISSSNNTVAGNYIGINANGDAGLGNTSNGITLQGGTAVNNTIGGTAPGAGNVIADNSNGIVITDATSQGNTVAGNIIGTKADRTGSIPNGRGITIAGSSTLNTVGGSAVAANLITNSTAQGVFIVSPAADNNTVSYNVIHSNGGLGIDLDGAGSNNDIAAPVIECSQNNGGGSYWVMGTSACNNCTVELFQVDSATVTADVSGAGEAFAFITTATTSATGSFGVTLTFPAAGAGTLLTGTVTDAAGNTSEFADNYDFTKLCDQCPGWQVTSTADSGMNTLRACIDQANSTVGANTITISTGGTVTLVSSLPVLTDDQTTIDGNGQSLVVDGNNAATDGLIINSATNTVQELAFVRFASAAIIIAGGGAHGNTIINNRIGLNFADAAAPNALGLVISGGAHDNTIGGARTASDTNVISGNTGHGILITDSGTNNNVVQGNNIGANTAGNGLKANGGAGVFVRGGPAGTLIGTNAANRYNIIAGNTGHGVHLQNNAVATVKGNYIGARPSLPTDFGNGGHGIFIENTDGVTLGGTVNAEERNYICHNQGDGLRVDASDNVSVTANYIGTDTTFNNMGNGANGINLVNGSSQNLIGHATRQNIIVFNNFAGISADGAGAATNTFTHNRIFENGGIGIELLNGANAGIATPTITFVDNMGGGLYDVTVEVPQLPADCSLGAPCTLELFVADNSGAPSALPDPSGAGEGFDFATAQAVTASCAATCTVVFTNVNFGGLFPNSTVISATITDGGGNTSRFSKNFALPVPSTCPTVSVNTDARPVAPPGSLRDCIKRANSGGALDKIIVFDNAMAGQTIQLVSPLDYNAFIDASAIYTSDVSITNTTPGEVIVRGMGTGQNCLHIMARASATAHIENITIDGLTFLNCSEAIRVYNESSTNIFDIQNVTISNNHFGVTRTGASGPAFRNRYGVTVLHGKNVTIENNTIANSMQTGIWAKFPKTSGLIIRDNYIGTNAAGAAGLGNTEYGMRIDENVSAAIIDGNVIASNGLAGMTVIGATNITITGNYIGTNPLGTTARPNGVGLHMVRTSASRIGGSRAANEGNIISGNTAEGLFFDDSVVSNVFTGNTIGLDAAGNVMGNGSHGVNIAGYEDHDNYFGLQTADSANIIAHNGGAGLVMTPKYVAGVANQSKNLFSQNVMYENTLKGLYVPLDTNGNIRPPVFNIITPTAAGVVDISGTTSPVCNTCRVELFRVDNNVGAIVTPDPTGAGEAWQYLGHATTTVTGNWSLSSFSFATATGEWMTATVTDALYNTSEFATNETVNYCPMIYSNADSGPNTLRECITQANTRGGSYKTITFHTSLANATITLATALPAFATDGITISNNSGGQITVSGAAGNFNCFTINSANNAIRGLSIVSCAGAGSPAAIRISGAGAQNNTIAGNKIGTNNAFATGAGNGVGVAIAAGASGNTIGGSASADANVIVASMADGVVIDAASTNNVFGNTVGTNAALATGLGNGGHGIRLQNGATGNIIGGTGAGQATNTILFNTSAGVSADGGATTGNDISQNIIYNNNWLGIALTGGAHNGLAQPVISTVAKTGANVFTVTGDGAANSCNNCVVELFRVDDTLSGVSADISGAGEAYAYIASTTSSATGAFAFYGVTVSGGSWLTVTATHAADGTSEFAINKEAVNDPPFIWPGTPAFSPVSIMPNGVATATLTFEADDPNGVPDITTAPASVVIDMTPVNGASGSVVMIGTIAGGNGGLMFEAAGLTAYNAAGLATGSYTLTATVTDQWGATGTATMDLIIENAPPIVTNAAATPTTVVPGTPNVAFSADVFDFNGLSDILSVTIDLSPINGPAAFTMYDDGTNGDTTAGDGHYTVGGYTIPLTAPFGNHTIIVKATDKSGATATDSFILQMGGLPVVVSVNFNPPAIPPDATTITNIEVVVDDPDGQADIARVYIILDPIKSAPMTLDLVYSGAVAGGFLYIGATTVDAGFLPGTYTLTAWASDATALTDSATGDLGVTNMPPVILTATATPYDAATGIAGFDQFTFTADVEDGNGLSDIDAVTIDLSPIGGPSAFLLYDDATNGDITAADGTYTFAAYTVLPGAPAGTHTLTVSATDGDATDTATVTIRINSPPVITHMEFVPAQMIADGVSSTQLRIDILDVDGRQDFATVTVDLSALGIIPAVQGLVYDTMAGANTYRYILNGVTPPMNYPTGTYFATGTVTDIFTRTATGAAQLEIVTTVPAAPVLVSVTSSSSTVAVLWRSPFRNTDGTALTNLDGHNLWRRSATGTYATVPFYVDNTSATNTAILYTDAAVTAYETYCYKVTAFNTSALESAASAERCVMVYPPAWVYKQTCGDVAAGGFPAPSTPGFFNRPMDVAVDDQGNIFVADTDNHRIQKFDKFCVFKGWRGGFGNTPGKFKSPSGITWNPADGNLYVVDRYDRVQVFNTSDTLDVQPGAFSFYEPITIQAGDGSTFFITQTNSALVTKVDNIGAILATYTFTSPRGVDTDSSGNIYVTDVVEHKVYKMDSAGAVITSWGGVGSAPGLFNEPFGISVDSNHGNVFVADTKNNRIQVFDLDGKIVNMVGDGVGMNYGQLRFPTGVAISHNGQLAPLFSSLIVADRYNNRVQEFGPPGS